jgi:hypothetical protein
MEGSGSGATPRSTAASASPVTAGNSLTVFVWYSGSGSTANAPTNLFVTGNGNTFLYQGLTSLDASSGVATFTCASALAGTTTVTATFSGGAVQGVYAREDSSLGAFVSLVGSLYAGAGATGANLNSSGAVSGVTGPATIIAFTVDTNTTTVVPTPGTGFTGRTGVWSGANAGNACAISEDQAISSNVAATFGILTGNQYDTFLTPAAVFQAAATNVLMPQICL